MYRLLLVTIAVAFMNVSLYDCISSTPVPAVTGTPGPTAPTTPGPTTLGPTTHGPTTLGPTTHGPTTLGPTTLGPTTLGPTTLGPTTLGPTTLGPTTLGPTTHGPTTHGPTTHGSTAPTTPSGPVLDPALCKTEGFFRNPHDCTLYYRCFKEGDRLVLYDYRSKPCPSGLVFDEETQVCANKETTAPCHNVP